MIFCFWMNEGFRSSSWRPSQRIRIPSLARRLLLDTYRTFGCESGQPTFRYSLLDGVKDGYLINPTVVDARTEITTQLLSENGFTATFFDDTGENDEVIRLPQRQSKNRSLGGAEISADRGGGLYEHLGGDILATIKEETIGQEGMKIDRMFFEKFEDTVRENAFIAQAVEVGQWDRVIDYVNREVFDKPDEYYNLEKLRKAAAVDRRLTLREILEKIFGLIPRFKSKDELLEEEFAKFTADIRPEEVGAIPAIKMYFKAYVTSDQVRYVIDSKQFTDLATNPVFSILDFRQVPEKYRTLVPEYIKDYVSLNQFAA